VVVEKSRTISEVAKSYGLVPQTVGNWVNKWRKTHSGTESEEMTAAQLAEYKKIKAELREARTGDRVPAKKAAAFLRGGSPGEEHDTHTPLREEGNHPGTCVMCHCPGGVAFRAATPGATGVCRKPTKRREELAIL